MKSLGFAYYTWLLLSYFSIGEICPYEIPCIGIGASLNPEFFFGPNPFG